MNSTQEEAASASASTGAIYSTLENPINKRMCLSRTSSSDIKSCHRTQHPQTKVEMTPIEEEFFTVKKAIKTIQHSKCFRGGSGHQGHVLIGDISVVHSASESFVLNHIKTIRGRVCHPRKYKHRYEDIPDIVSDTYVVREDAFVVLFNAQYKGRIYYMALRDTTAAELFGLYARRALKICGESCTGYYYGKCDCPVSVFQDMCTGLKEPTTSVEDYAKRICTICDMGIDTVATAIIYMERVMYFEEQYGLKTHITPLTVHRFMLAAAVVACKYLVDGPVKNSYVASYCGISTNEINNLEIEFLRSIRFSLSITEAEFFTCMTTLEYERISTIAANAITVATSKCSSSSSSSTSNETLMVDRIPIQFTPKDEFICNTTVNEDVPCCAGG